MRALTFTAPGVVELRDAPEPAVLPGETLVHVVAAGICGSELHGVRNPGFRVPPLVMGHEFAGITDDGSRVVINPILSCGHCELCRGGQRNVCRERQIIGVHRAGGFAERVAVPRAVLRDLPEGVSFQAAAVIEPAANAVHAWVLAGRPAGARVGIVGAGAIGLFCLLVALSGGAASVDVADLSEERLAVAAELGATSTGVALTGEYDVVFDAVGAAATHEQSLTHLRPGGTAVWLGLADPVAGFDSTALVRTEKRILGSFAYADDEFEDAIQMVSRWNLDWVGMFDLEMGAEIFTELMNGRGVPVKALLRTQPTSEPPGSGASRSVQGDLTGAIS